LATELHVNVSGPDGVGLGSEHVLDGEDRDNYINRALATGINFPVVSVRKP
jgi:hypothetical protein